VNDDLRRSAAHVFVADMDAPALGPDDLHHVTRVLRVGPTDTVSFSDGRGRWCLATLGPDGTLRPQGGPVCEPDPVALRVSFAPVAAVKPSAVVRQLTEVGVTDIDVLAPTRRGVSRPRIDAERLARVAREAAMQSRRVHLPTVRVNVTLAEVLAAGAAVADPSGGPIGDHRHVVVGPEGGFDADEIAGAPLVSLGDTVLRAETAAVVAAALMAARVTT
jgi:16S rRNA (uracil1498-N3)-methyltransferase